MGMRVKSAIVFLTGLALLIGIPVPVSGAGAEPRPCKNILNHLTRGLPNRVRQLMGAVVASSVIALATRDAHDYIAQQRFIAQLKNKSIKPDEVELIPFLIEALESKMHPRHRSEAEAALKRMPPQVVAKQLPSLIALVASRGDSDNLAADLIGSLGEKANVAQESLMTAIEQNAVEKRFFRFCEFIQPLSKIGDLSEDTNRRLLIVVQEKIEPELRNGGQNVNWDPTLLQTPALAIAHSGLPSNQPLYQEHLRSAWKTAVNILVREGNPIRAEVTSYLAKVEEDPGIAALLTSENNRQ